MFQRAVARSPEVSISVLGQNVRFVLDTGSEVTILPEAIYHLLENRKPLQDISGWLKVYAANGIEVPYLGYTELDMDILGIQLGRVAVLVSPTSAASSASLTGLLGCNVIREIRSALIEKNGRSYLQTVRDNPWTDALLACEVEDKADAKVRFVKVAGRQPILLPAQSHRVVTCTTTGARRSLSSKEVVIEAPHGHTGNLPRNVAVVNTCSSVQNGLVSVRVTNIGEEICVVTATDTPWGNDWWTGS